MSETILNIDEIISDPNIRSGRPVIRGTAICVSDVVSWHTSGDELNPEQIAAQFRLGLGQVYAALAYYHLHKTRIDAEIQVSISEAQALIDELKSQERLTEID